MATNTIVLDFEECTPTPANGYLVKYRPLDSSEDYRIVSPNPYSSPVTIIDTNDPVGTSYEGTIQGDCGGGNLGVPVPWVAINEISPSISDTPSGSGGGSISIPPEEFDYYFATRVLCDGCFELDTVLVRVPAGHVVQVGKYYTPVGHPTGFVYTLETTPQPPASSVELTGLNYNTCVLACGS